MIQIEHRSLSAFKKHSLAVAHLPVEKRRNIGEVRFDSTGTGEILLDHLLAEVDDLRDMPAGDERQRTFTGP